ncbi:hypothetical protein [Bradyrhizobium sp. ARR65]|uniref:hypothetical protein n=1 Tax=Bradyrhizobium sp. ARR65 TaxID=1040989 RepID=UPI00054D3FF5|nr:hypothetical protein [Bradyrhizobium sp. ARR65]
MLRFKLRFTILVSAVPLVAGAILAGVQAFERPRPCIAVGATTLEIGSAPWHADLHVSFTDDPSLATVRVGVTDSAANADFAVIDDIDDAEENTCKANATQFVALSAQPSASAPVIYISHGGAADYRIFVRSRHFSLREAAALIVGAHGERPRLAAAL